MEKTQREKDSAFRVAVRVRPLTKSELSAEDPVKGEPAITPILTVEDNLVTSCFYSGLDICKSK